MFVTDSKDNCMRRTKKLLMNFQKKLTLTKRTETDTGKLIKKIKVLE